MGVHSHFHVQPNYSVEVVLFCVVVGVVTIKTTTTILTTSTTAKETQRNGVVTAS